MRGYKLPPKRDVAQGLLLRGSIFVHLDPRVNGVVVPAWLSKQPQLVLQVGLDLPIPIPDLRIDETGVFGTLSFQRSPFTCFVPWEGVFALVGDDGKGLVWPESMPPEIAREVAHEAERRAIKRPSGSPDPTPSPNPGLRGEISHIGPKPEVESSFKSVSSRSGKARELPPYLRVVK